MRRRSTQRRHLEDALFELCAERRLAEVDLGMLLARAAVSPGHFARHFDDVEDCFCALYTRLRDQFMLEVGSAFAAERRWRDGVRAAAHAMLAYLLADSTRARISFVEVLHAGDRAILIRDQTMQMLFEIIDLGRAEPGAPDGLTRATAEALGSAIYQRIQSALEADDVEAIVRGMPEMVYFTVLPYLGPEAASEELELPPPRPAHAVEA